MATTAGFRSGFVAAFLVTVTLSTALFFGSHAGSAFDRSFFPILGAAFGFGLVCLLVRRTRAFGRGLMFGAAASLMLQIAILMSLPFVLG